MTYKLAVKEKVVAMYQAGVSCREISLTEEIPLSTIRSWTVDVLLSPRTFFCAVCGKNKRTKNIQQIYCSESCKNRANYQRRLKKTNKALSVRPCDRCGKEYQPKHGNDRYCGVKCRNLNKRERVERASEVRKQLEVQQREVAEQFASAMNRVESGIKAAMNDGRISGVAYRAELDTIEAYYQKHESSISQRLRDRIQDIFRSVR
ncbi:MAG: hypothetical protein F4Z01_06865 [Gammaproteobacteria bacterium]|nr:hypothetical protein [Gammaproteobacteria bacterium]